MNITSNKLFNEAMEFKVFFILIIAASFVVAEEPEKVVIIKKAWCSYLDKRLYPCEELNRRLRYPPTDELNSLDVDIPENVDD